MTRDVVSEALDALEFGVWMFDRGSGAAEWSPRMAVLHDVEDRSGARGDLFAHVARDDRPSVDEAVAHVDEVDRPQTVEYRVILAGDPQVRRWVSTRFAAVRSDETSLVSAISLDITAEKTAELAARRRRAQIEGLQWVTRAIIAGEALHDTARALTEASAEVLAASIAVLLYEAPGDGVDRTERAVGGPGRRELGPVPDQIEWDAPIVGARVLVVDDPAGRRELVALGMPRDVLDDLGTVMVAPAHPHGILLFGHSEPDAFSAEDIELAAAIASSASIALRGARQHQQHWLAARTFQRQLLPTDTAIEGAELCVRYHPGRDGLDVGGDWYEVIDLGHGRVGLAVGDVCGHGLQAAAHMGQLRYAFRALVRSSSAPEEAFEVLNDIARNELHTTATVAYVELDVTSGACAVWRCGHLPPMTVDEDDGRVRAIGDLSDGGPMLGFLDVVDVRPVRTTLAETEVLLLYTDGLVERRGESIDIGIGRLEQALGHHRRPTLDERCDSLYDALAVRGPDADDVALLAVRRV